MKVNVVMFAVARDIIGANAIEVEVTDPATVGNLKQALIEQYPGLAEVVKRSAFSVNHEYANDNSSLDDQAEIALIPPVSGG